MNALAHRQRHAAAQNLESTVWDLLVIGGGIVGSGIAREAASRGLSVALVEQDDFAFGTSSRSSRLLHGGLRYLEQGRIGLVHEASREKKILQRIAPHLASPLAFVFPAYRKSGRPLWQLHIGVKIYDLLCGGRNLGPSRRLSRAETLQQLPDLRSEGLTGAVRYFDALTNDARLVLDTLRSATRHGATLLNYATFRDARATEGLWRGTVTDRPSGRLLDVRARTMVNATGPWAQGLGPSAVRLRLSKGIHLVADRRRLPVPDAVVITADRRILFVIPWGTRVIIGTTDTDYRGRPEQAAVESADIDYLLHTVNAVFPAVDLTPADVISSWAGVRPLIAQADGSPSDISRAHQIRSPQPGWWDVAGGKLTTYRLMAEQTVDRIGRYLGRRLPVSRTAEEPLLTEPEPASGILPPPCSRDLVKHYIEQEWAVHLDDVLLRRSGWHYYDPPVTAPVERVADWMAELAGWSPGERQAEIAAYRQAAGLAAPPVGGSPTSAIPR